MAAQAAGGHRSGFWRRVGVVLAAYALVVQSALAGLAHHPAPERLALALTLCSGDDASAPAQNRDRFACCGVGCLGAPQPAPSPAGGAALLARPAALAFAASPGAAVERLAQRSDGPAFARGPPA
ncbi:hypothetical protein [Methylopila turkensis]|uniref:DUF2946 domain-containing protein n=1 Tax=Methylopila turkensis TaxID=1437816 RepID=A0A9W6JMH6_9HYPH|nr:hypothetical protein [Methylopila turkensis]GLK78545.1 hypothetical protein GCM10008174_02860 [Methylopila turkensis]